MCHVDNSWLPLINCSLTASVFVFCCQSSSGKVHILLWRQVIETFQQKYVCLLMKVVLFKNDYWNYFLSLT